MPADILVILLIWSFAALECVAWDKKDVVYFRTLFWKRWKIIKPSRLLQNTFGGLAFLFPVPPLGVQPRAHHQRIAFSPEGLSNYVPESGDPSPAGEKDHYLYDEIVRVEAGGDEIIINGRPFARVHSRAEAIRLVELIRRARGIRRRDREALIEGHVAGLFSRSRINGAVGDFRAKTGRLLVFDNLLWLCLIVGMPSFIYIYGFSRAVLPMLALVLALHLAVTGMTFWTHRALYGRPDFSILYTLLPSPFHSVRAVDHLAKTLLSPYHPFAVAGALLDRDRIMNFARQSLALIRHPLRDNLGSAKSNEIDQWYKDRIVRAMEDTVRDLRIDLESLGQPDAAGLEANYSSFCPRCLALYEISGGVCSDCPDMTLVSLKGRPKDAGPVT